ncbi:MAG: glucosaminidase domain-containing protein [Flavobacterium sp.]|nr:glucosaminidase domain-containing protein [Flavobacterium sp.]
MFKKIILLFLIILIASCGSSKPVASASYSKKPVVHVVKKPIRPIVIASEKKEVNVVEKINQPETISLEATSRVKVTTEMVLTYIVKYKDIAKNNMKQFGIPASITLSQAILESGCGTGNLCLLANNHFGIKCRKDWTGPSVKYDDDAAQECFRKYTDPKDSFKDHSSFLLSKSWYANLFQLNKKDYKAWARGLKSAGYATDPQYPQKLITIIEKYKLYEIDNEINLENSFDSINNEIVNTDNYYTVMPKDTFYSVSKKFSVGIDELKKLNNLTENSLSIGQKLKIK